MTPAPLQGFPPGALQWGHLPHCKSLTVIFPNPVQHAHVKVLLIAQGLTLVQTLHRARPWFPPGIICQETLGVTSPGGVTQHSTGTHRTQAWKHLTKRFPFLYSCLLLGAPPEMRQLSGMHMVRYYQRAKSGQREKLGTKYCKIRMKRVKQKHRPERPDQTAECRLHIWLRVS